ncbi:MAG: hypothetical protein PHR52_12875 [Fermentimonas sp.]|nr:hypothetical protein [Fermentimonas sp.]
MEKEDRSPILVNNPYRNVLMNVEPLFRLIRLYSIDECIGIADRSIKLAALASESEWTTEYERKEALVFFYEIRALFTSMKECQISVPNKKGGFNG